ncbi:hypothetical protein ACFQ1I_27365 [Kitasatospora arboriphila]
MVGDRLEGRTLPFITLSRRMYEPPSQATTPRNSTPQTTAAIRSRRSASASERRL